MIKSILFKKTNTLDDELFSIDFSNHINIIIGPKGGGKSTLFDLVAGLKQKVIYESVIFALKSFNIEFVKATTFSNDDIMLKDLTLKKNKNDKANDYDNRYDVIYQDDPIKKDINTFKDIDKEKEVYVKEVINNSDDIINFIKKFEDLHFNVQIFVKLNNSNQINWNNTFSFEKSDKELDIITKLDYNNDDLISRVSTDTSKIDKMMRQHLESKNQYLETLNGYDPNFVYKDNEFNKLLFEKINFLIKTTDELFSMLKHRKKVIGKIGTASNIFKSLYKRKVELIKSKNNNSTKLKEFEVSSKKYMVDFARQAKNLKKMFKSLLQSKITVELNSNEVTHHFLSYKIDNKIHIDEDFVIDEIFKKIFYVPKKSLTDINQWINNNSTMVKSFSADTIKNSIIKYLVDKVDVLANGVSYKTMSLGEKSIYGMKYKFNKSINDDLFLDQPEDNLDNYTIANNILEMISQKKNQQVFIVTHNANIGILTKPEKIIVANIKDDKNQYFEGVIENTTTDQSDSAHYLEGGLNFLEQRYKIIKGEN